SALAGNLVSLIQTATSSITTQAAGTSSGVNSTDIAKAQQPGAVTLVGNSFAENVFRRSDLAAAAAADSSTGTVPASTNLAAISPLATNVLPSVPAASMTSALDKSNL